MTRSALWEIHLENRQAKVTTKHSELRIKLEHCVQHVVAHSPIEMWPKVSPKSKGENMLLILRDIVLDCKETLNAGQV